jgi:Peptidase family S41
VARPGDEPGGISKKKAYFKERFHLFGMYMSSPFTALRLCFNLFCPLFALVLLSVGASAQSCNCRDEFQYLQRYMEQNYAGFKDKATAGNRAAYDSTASSVDHRAARTSKPRFCLALMREWLNFFRDRHNTISQNAKVDATNGGGEAIRFTHRPDLVARQLSVQTFYIGIGSFDESNAAAIDSLFRANSVLLRAIPNLVLDLRGNGGGSDFAYQPLTPLIYTDPVHGTGVDVLATSDNVRTWSALLDDKYITGWTRYSIQNTITAMKGHLGQLIAVSPDRVATLREVRPFPQRVAVLIDGDCASTTEQFLLEAVQSSKVTLMGRHTAGILDYSNVREQPFDCLPFTLHYATTRSRRIDQGKGIDNTGIQPAVVLGDDVDWVEAAKKYLEERH